MEPTYDDAPPPEPVNDAGVTHFPTEPFIAKGGGTIGRFATVFIAGIVVAIGIAFAFSLIAWLAIAFFFIFPLVFGCLTGVGIGMIAHAARARSGRGSMAITMIALMCGALAYVSFHGLYHLRDIDPDAVAGESFMGSLERRATKGYVLRGKRGGNTNFGYTGTWIYWSFELGITILGTVAVANSLSKGPYCEICDKWNRKRTFGPFPFDALAGHEAFTAGEPTRMFVPGPDDNKVTIEVYDCPTCPDDPLSIKYNGTIGSGKTMKTHKAFLVYPHEALPAFEAIELIANQPKG